MFSFSTLLFFNIRKFNCSTENNASKITTESSGNFAKCKEILLQKNFHHTYRNFTLEDGKRITKMVYDTKLEKITFPIKMQLSWPKAPDGTEYEIQRKNLFFNLYAHALPGISDRKVRFGKKEAVRILLYDLGDKTKLLCEALLCMNYALKKINQEEVEQIIYNLVDIKLKEKNNLNFEQVCKNNNCENIVYEMQANINSQGGNLQKNTFNMGRNMQSNLLFMTVLTGSCCIAPYYIKFP
ncbi:uncharacterized protein VNE69_12120 [Vairimorpha necatrix]|uniref:LAGLIDADG homing endonuclease n=1 Tax=Vairimorpha necatrix TaxID=6039 RepID=A0AAX4JGR8_9MICR